MSVDAGEVQEQGLAGRLAQWRAARSEAATSPGTSATDAVGELLATLDALPDALLVLNADGIVTWASSGTSDVLGWLPHELMGRSIAVVALEEDVEQQQRLLGEVRRTGQAVTFSALRRRSDGEVVELSVSMAPVRDHATGEYVGTCGSVRRVAPEVRLKTPLTQQDSLSVALNRRSSDVALIANADTEITVASPSVVDVLGFTPEQLVGANGLGLVHEDDLAGVAEFVARVVSSPGAVERRTFRVTNAHGEWRWIEETLTNCIDVPGVQGLVANLRDVTSEVEARAALTTSERRYRTIVETAQEGVLVIDDQARVLLVNAMAAEMIGHARTELFRRPLTSFVDERTREVIENRITVRTPKGHERFELTYPHPDGGSRVFAIAGSPISLDAGGATGSLAMITDVTEARRIEGELQHRALHDILTGLPNRALLADRLSMALSRRTVSRADLGIAVLSVNLDGFKLINDAHGREFGDTVLVEVAERLCRAVRPGDTVARIGGDEFLVVAEDVDVDAALALADQLRSSLLEPVVPSSATLYVDASIGVAVGTSESAASLLKSADDALRQAKAYGRGRVHVFDASCETDTGRRLQVANALRTALDTDQLTLGYQPIVDLTHGHVVGVEALLRWEHPELGFIPPPELVAVAHSTGLAERLDERVLHRACTDMARLSARGVGGQLNLSVNLGAQSFDATRLLPMLGDATRLSGWPMGQLTLELTEGVLMRDTEGAAGLVTRLRDLDVSVAIDDFGTGYSSLAYLRRLPVATLKIDRSFVEHVPGDPASCALTRYSADLAHALSLTTVAEGIETQDQADYMRRIGCDRGQGYLWSPAVSPSQLEDLLLAWPGAGDCLSA